MTEQLDRVLKDADQTIAVPDEQGLEPDPAPDRTRKFSYTNFSRMRTRWPQADQMRIEDLHYQADQIIRAQFKVAFDVIEQIYRVVRDTSRDPDTGQIRTGSDGRPVWITDEFGNPAEKWSNLDAQWRSNFLFAITVHLFEWEQMSFDSWAEAMYAKVVWEDKFATGFLGQPGVQVSGKPTVDDRTQTGHKHSIDERYFAVFKAVLSKKAEGVVRSMTRLERLLSASEDR